MLNQLTQGSFGFSDNLLFITLKKKLSAGWKVLSIECFRDA